MDKLIVSGGKRLEGEILVSGSKNTVLPIMCAALLGNSPSLIHNVPRLRDVLAMIQILKTLGAEIEFESEHSLRIDPRGVNNNTAPYELVRKMRASVCVLGPLIGKFGEANVSLPGGCVIGPRPVDIHIKGLRALGVTVSVEHGDIRAKGRPRGGEVFLGGRFGASVTGTANILMASVLGQGQTFIESAAMEPEIQELSEFLQKMGGRITGTGSHILKIKGVDELCGVEWTIGSDRIEAGTFLIGAVMTQGEILVRNCYKRHLSAVLDKLRQTGAEVLDDSRGIRIRSFQAPRPVDITTLPFPGFPTDLQAQMMALMSLGDGISVITEKVYPERFMHISELNRLGAGISLEGPTAIIRGQRKLSGAPVMASDLRASAALILAGLVAGGETTVQRVYHIDRGYESIEKKLNSLGADIRRVPE